MLALALAACAAEADDPAQPDGAAQSDGAAGSDSAVRTDDPAGTDGAGEATSPSGEAAPTPDGAAPPAGEVVGVLPEDVTFEPSPLVEGATSATLIGDPTGDGLYVLLGEIAEAVVFPTHSHPDDRITTVVSGTMYFSTGADFDRDQVVAYPAGSVVYTPAGTPHTMWARDGDIVVQEAGEGPTGLELVGEAE